MSTSAETPQKPIWSLIPDGDLPNHRLLDGKHHIGCMVTQGRAIKVATSLFADEVTDGSNCLNQHDRPGELCQICESRNQAWKERVAQVRRAMFEAFS